MKRKRRVSEEVKRARELRREGTLAERVLWGRLRGRRAGGIKFRRQVPVGIYVADFLCVEHLVVVELDGWSHEKTGERDERRDLWLREQGYRVLRFANEDVLRDGGVGVAETVMAVVAGRMSEKLEVIEKGTG